MKRQIIDIETLEVWESVAKCAKAIGVSYQNVIHQINVGGRCGSGCGQRSGGHRLEYFDFWFEAYTKAEKESYTRKNNIFFL